MAVEACMHCGAALGGAWRDTGRCESCRGVVATVTASLPFDDAPLARLIAFDVETTGLYTDSAGITEIGAVKFTADGTVVDTFASLANPGYRVTPPITRLTGITQPMVAKAKPIDDVLRDWLAWLGPAPLLVAHNAPFDLQFVHAALDRLGEEGLEFRVVDTLAWARAASLPVPDHKLETLLDHIGYKAERLHRAAADAAGVMALCLFLAARDGHAEPAACCQCLERRAQKSRLLCALRPAYRRPTKK